MPTNDQTAFNTMKVYLESKEIEQMEQADEYLRDKILIRLLFRLGCRISEILGIGSMSGAFDSFSLFISPDLSLS